MKSWSSELLYASYDTSKSCKSPLSEQTHRVEDHPGHHVRVHVRRRAAVLEVALLLRLRCPGDADGSSAVGHPV